VFHDRNTYRFKKALRQPGVVDFKILILSTFRVGAAGFMI
jgi:hypothetical protein